MLFTIIALVAVIAVALYVAKKTKRNSTPTPTFVEVPSIHEEIVKTVEEAKTQKPIVDEVSKPKAPKAPKTAAPKTTAPTMTAKKQPTKTPKTNKNA